MRKIVLIFLSIISLVSTTSFAHPPLEGINAKEITFYGIDYSHFRLIHKADFVDKLGTTQCQALKSRYLQEWNEIFITEKSKFDIAKLFVVDKFTLDLDRSIATLGGYTADCVLEDEGYKINESDFSAIIAKYIDKTKQGTGVVMVGESINKEDNVAKYYIVYFNINTGAILDKRFITGKPGGSGFSNYWVNALYDALVTNIPDLKKLRKGK
jgi:hypothetical protein